MAKKDFDKYFNGLRITLAEDKAALDKLKEALSLGEANEGIVKAAEKAFVDDTYRYQVFLSAKGLIDKRKPRKKRVNNNGNSN